MRDSVAKLGAAFAAFVYFVGLLIVNLHLGSRGFHAMGLAQVEYIAGSPWVLAVSFVSAATAVLVAKWRASRVPESAVATGCVRWLLISGAFSISVTAVGLALRENVTTTIVGILVSGVCVYFTIYLARDVPAIFEVEGPTDEVRTFRLDIASKAVTSFICLLGVGIIAYACLSYPHLDRALGGGYSRKVSLYMRQDQPQVIAALNGIAAAVENSYKSPPASKGSTTAAVVVNIVAETNDTYIVRVGDWLHSQTVAIDKDAVALIVCQ